jgi:GTP-binding protein HflX
MSGHENDSTARERGPSEKRPRAVVLGVQLGDVSDGDFESSLMELERLGKTLGLLPVGRVTQKRAGLASASVVGEGKLKELAEWTGGSGEIPSGAVRKKRRIDAKDDAASDPAADDEVEDDDLPLPFTGEGRGEGTTRSPDATTAAQPRATVVLVDHDLAPSQVGNLERATGAEVLDRSSVILRIFERHARTREARMQVEIARLTYLAPRLRESGGGDRQRGGIGGKGAGESAVELDRRRARDRIAELRQELANIEREAGVRRQRRVSQRTVALVGYTNAGKSSWMRLLTSGEVYVADELFATLDTTVRALVPEPRPRILVSDTVGFIKKLPHALVASFRSTLEEARDAGLLVHVVDASDPAFRAQLEVTRTVLSELHADEAPSMLLLNKIDRVSPDDLRALREEFPDALMVSARDKDDLKRVHAAIVDFFEKDAVETELFVSYAKQSLIGPIREVARVLEERWDEDGLHVRVKGPAGAIAKLQAQLAS